VIIGLVNVGVAIVGLVANTTAPEPVDVVPPVPPEATGKAFANVTTWAELTVTAVVGAAPVWITSAPVVSASTEYAVVVVVDDFMVVIWLRAFVLLQGW